MINYSIIIPHRNIPILLNRCINSIPLRDDIEIIVVDDNSDPNIVDFRLFPGIKNDNLKVILTKEGLGAGYARNIGLNVAQGKWLIFADSDDYFMTENLSTMMDTYLDSMADIVYFNVECRYSDSLILAPNADKQYYRFIESKDSKTLCRYKLRVPWGKFIKRKLVVSNNIKFDELKVANDRIFSLYSGILASIVEVDKTPIYVWLVRKGSLTSIKSKEYVLLHFNVSVRANDILETHSLSKYRGNLFFSVPSLRRASLSYKEIYKLVLCNTPPKYMLMNFLESVLTFIINKLRL